MKKIGIIFAVVFCVLSSTVVFASNTTIQNNNVVQKNNTVVQDNKNDKDSKDAKTQQLVEIKDKEKKTLEDYQKAYESESYGLTAYILSRVQIYSIPFCFIGVAISGIYQYVLGIRKLDTRDKGFAIMISIVTIFIIAQILPLIFAIVVKGWRG